MKAFFTNYHISVNPTLVRDLIASGIEVVMPSIEFAQSRITFFAANDEHVAEGARIISYEEFMAMEPMALICPCIQHIDDYRRLYEQRGCVDELVYLTANSNSADFFPLDGAKFVMSHDLYYHRKTKAPYRIWYFNQPTIKVSVKSEEDIRTTFEEKKIKLYVNNFYNGGFEPEIEAAEEFRDKWEKLTGYRVPFYGYDNPSGWLQPMEKTHKEMRDSMFTLCFKRRETWGQMVNESMQIGTPTIMLRPLLWSTFTDYLINEDVCVIGETVDELIVRLNSMTLAEYETMVRESQWQSRMYCNDQLNREKLKWLFGKIEQELLTKEQ